MMTALKQYWHVFWQFRSIHLMKLLEYRKDFFFWSAISLIWTTINIFFYTVLYSVTDQIAGWGKYEMYVLVGFYTMADSVIWGVFYYNMQRYTNAIFDGELSMLFTKPINTQFLLMTQYNNYNNVPRFFIGLFLVVWSLWNIGVSPTALDIALASIMFTLSLICMYYIWFILSTLTFYVERLDNINEIIPALRRIWTFPKAVYPGLLGWIISTIIPLALVTTLPSEILISSPKLSDMGWLLGMTVVFGCLSHYFFHFSVKRYSGIAN